MKQRRKNTTVAPPTKRRRLCPADYEGTCPFVVENPDWLVGAD